MAKEEPIVLPSKQIYNPKVLISNWEAGNMCEPRDNNPFKKEGGTSYHLSSYKRFGCDDVPFMSETQHMLEQIWTRQDPVYIFKPLVNFMSYPCTDTPGRNRLMKQANMAQLPPDYGCMDYRSTQQRAYRNPNPEVMSPLTMKSLTTPWLINRRIISDLTQSGSAAPAPGEYKHLDEHTPINHVREMRSHRYISFNPNTCNPFPCKP